MGVPIAATTARVASPLLAQAPRQPHPRGIVLKSRVFPQKLIDESWGGQNRHTHGKGRRACVGAAGLLPSHVGAHESEAEELPMQPPAARCDFSTLTRLVAVLAVATAMLALLAATAGSAGAQVQIGLNFTGRVPDSPTLLPLWPHRPDTMGAVGEQHIVELLNNGYAVYSKSDGAVLQRTITLNEFWNAAGVTPLGTSVDPRFLDDAAKQRWFAVSIDGLFPDDPNAGSISPNNYLVAVSKSADPTQGWTGFKIDGDATDTGAVHYSYLGSRDERRRPLCGRPAERGQAGTLAILGTDPPRVAEGRPARIDAVGGERHELVEPAALPGGLVAAAGRESRRNGPSGDASVGEQRLLWLSPVERDRRLDRVARPRSAGAHLCRSHHSVALPRPATGNQGRSPRRLCHVQRERGAGQRLDLGCPDRRGWTAAWPCVGTRSTRPRTSCSNPET
jgi:hypothetical protein